MGELSHYEHVPRNQAGNQLIEGKFKPRRYQIEGARLIQQYGGRALLADDMGLGKTVQACMWLSKRPSALPAVIACPAAVKIHWQRTFEKVTGKTAQVLYGRKAHPARPDVLQPDCYVINYEILQYWREFLQAQDFRTFIMDEVQRCGNRKTITTSSCMDLASYAAYVLGLSGTPLQNCPADLWPALNMIWPDKFPNFWQYGHRYCGAKHTPWGWNFRGACNLGDLRKKLLQAGMIRRTQMEVLSELPEKNREVLVLPMGDYQRYYRAAAHFLRWLADEKGSVAAHRASKAEQLVRLGHLRRLAAELKMEAALEWINSWLQENPEEKIVLYTTTKQIVSMLQKGVKTKCVVIDGATKDKGKVVEQFQQDNRVRAVIGNIRAAGTGLDGLQRVSSTAAFIELADRPVDHTQAERRLCRMGAREGHPFWFYYLVAAGTVEEDYCQLLQTKQRIVTEVLDGDDDESNLLDNLEIYEQLVDKLKGATEKATAGKRWAGTR